MARGWNGEMSLVIRSKNSIGKVKEIHKKALAIHYHRKPGVWTIAK
jgi:hypothetical protein